MNFNFLRKMSNLANLADSQSETVVSNGPSQCGSLRFGDSDQETKLNLENRQNRLGRSVANRLPEEQFS